MSNIDKVKSHVDFLSSEVKKEYQMVRGRKKVYNFKKKHIYENLKHNNIQDFFLVPKNTYSTNPFNNSGFYLDFTIPQLSHYSFNKFIFYFKVSNNTNNNCYVLIPPLMIDRISLLKNSNSLGIDINDHDIFLTNLHRYANTYNADKLGNFGLTVNSNSNFTAVDLLKGTSIDGTLELPLSLSESDFLVNLKLDYVIRIYFKGNIVIDGLQNSELVFSSPQLIMRCNELSTQSLSHILSQPKLTHFFNKRILTKYNIPSLSNGVPYTLNLTGFNHTASGLCLFLKHPESNITLAQTGGSLWYHNLFSIDNVSITDGTGRNILNNNVYNINYNYYLMRDSFKALSNYIRQFCINGNDGKFFVIPFVNNLSDAFDNVFCGGYSFKENEYKLKFTPTFSRDNLVMYAFWFVPSILELDFATGELEEYYG